MHGQLHFFTSFEHHERPDRPRCPRSKTTKLSRASAWRVKRMQILCSLNFDEFEIPSCFDLIPCTPTNSPNENHSRSPYRQLLAIVITSMTSSGKRLSSKLKPVVSKERFCEVYQTSLSTAPQFEAQKSHSLPPA